MKLVISLCTLLAKHLILQNWKSEKSHTHTWLKYLANVLHLERLQYTFMNKENTFCETLQPLLDIWEATYKTSTQCQLLLCGPTTYALWHILTKMLSSYQPTDDTGVSV